MPEAIEETRRYITGGRIDELVVDDLTMDDLPAIAWSGSPSHLRSVASYIERVPSGDVEYLAVRAPSGGPIAKACINYTEHEDAGTLIQVATHRELWGLGIATRLMSVAEDRIRARGVTWATLGVEDDNPRARRLYEHLGYEVFDREHASWEHEDDDGKVSTYETDIDLMRKRLV